jgi:tetratricopeptide (TPR) repeat protein
MRIKFVNAAVVCLVLLSGSACSRSVVAKKARYMEAGRRFYDQKDYARAILQFKNATDADPLDPEPDYRLGLAYLDSGEVSPAIQCFRKAAQINPRHAAAQLRLAEILSTSDNKELLNDAVQRVKLVLDSSVSAEALNTLALTEMKLDQPDSARKHLEEALAKFPESQSSYVILAKTRLLHHDLTGAEETLKKAVAASPRSSDGFVALGSFYALTQRTPQAEKCYRQALQLNGNDPAPMFQLAMLLYRTGRKQEAEPLFSRLSSFSDPAYQPLHAIYLIQEGERAAGIAELEKLYRAHPNSRPLRTQLVAAFWLDHRLADVEKIVNAALKTNPMDFDALLQRGELYLVQSKFSQAQADLDQVLYYRPDSGAVHYIMAKLSQARGTDLTYRQELTTALRLQPEMLQARLELAQSLIASNGASSALKVLDETPANQKNSLGVIIQRNWAWLAQKNLADLREGVRAGLAVSRNPDLLVQNAWLLLNENKPSEAQASVEEALKQAPLDSRALDALEAVYAARKQKNAFDQRLKQYAAQTSTPDVQLFAGNWALRKGDRSEARAFFKAAKLADPNFREADIALAQMDVADGNLESARSTLAKLMAARDQDADLWIRSAVVETSAHRYDQAIERYRKALALDHNNIFALNNLAYLLANAKQPDEALAYAQQAKELAPNTAPVEDTLGWVLYQKGIYGTALSHLETAAKTSSDPAVQYHLGLAYLKAGNRERGQQVLLAVLKTSPNMDEARMAKLEMGIP